MKKNTAKKTAGSPNKTDSNLLLRLLAGAAIFSLIVFCCVTLYPVFIEQPKQNAEKQTVLISTSAKSQADAINFIANQFQQRLDVAATQITPDFAEQDEAQQTAIRQQLRNQFIDAENISLIPLGPLGIAKLERDQFSRFGNVQLDLIRRINNGETVSPEAFSTQKVWQTSFISAIKNNTDDVISGALLLTIPADYFSQFLNKLNAGLGKASLMQSFKNRTIVFAESTGSGVSQYKASAPTTIGNWELEFTPSQQWLDQFSKQSSFALPLIGIGAVLLLVVFGLAYHSLRKTIQQDLITLAKAVASRNAKSARFNIADFTPLANELVAAQLKSATAAKAEPTETKKAPEKTADKEAEDEFVLDDIEENTPALSFTEDSLPAQIFRAYDIRGHAEEQLTDEIVHAIGIAIGSEALRQSQTQIVVARDGRHSSQRIVDALSKGLNDSGCDVIDIGMVPTPVLYFATYQLDTHSGVMVTGSHNPSEYNGLKIVLNSKALAGPEILALRQRILKNDLESGTGTIQQHNIDEDYIEHIVSDVAIAQHLKVVIDAGNGVTGDIAPRLFEELGCEIIPLYCDIDGDFPNHHPDPSVESNMADLIAKVQEEGADLGIAFDGDGDRIGVVTAKGNSVAADRLLMLFAQDVVSRNPGADVLFDVKCSRHLNSVISSYGGRPIMWKSGHSFMKEKMVETGALLGGEFSGHIFFKERWFGFDDGMYAGARLIEILSTINSDLDQQLEAFPQTVSSPEIKVSASDDEKFGIISQLINEGDFGEGKTSTLDGLRVDFGDGWGLVRCSNTTPALILRFEADTTDALQRIQSLFKEQLLAVNSSLALEF